MIVLIIWAWQGFLTCLMLFISDYRLYRPLKVKLNKDYAWYFVFGFIILIPWIIFEIVKLCNKSEDERQDYSLSFKERVFNSDIMHKSSYYAKRERLSQWN